MSAQVRVKDRDLEVVGHGKIAYLGATLGDVPEYVGVGTLEGMGAASLSSLCQALIRWRREKEKKFRNDAWGERRGSGKARVWVGIARTSEERFHRDLKGQDALWRGQDYRKTPPTSPAIFLEGDRLRVRIEVWRKEEPDPAAIGRLLGPFMKRRGASCEVAVDAVPEYERAGKGFDVAVDFDRSYPRGATVADAWKFGDEARALLRAVEKGELPKETALDLLCAGRWDLFYGQPESDWLEAKGAPYDHLIEKLGKNWRFELAKDVAAFANSPDGGLIVIGMDSENEGNGDIVKGPIEFDHSRVEGSVYRQHIAQIVYPRVAGFEVKLVEGSEEGWGLAVLVIPPQPESSRPFLVNGAISDRKVVANHVLLPMRREDDTAWADLGALHARLRLGEQVIAGEKRLPISRKKS